jgi:spore coat polysaccharide biosynthesis protein SpsF
VKVTALVQARFSSERLPGKVLARIAGKPLLGHVFERLERCAKIDGFALVTSDRSSDDPVEEFCRRSQVRCVRGPLEDVAGRFLAATKELSLEAFVRVNGDSPFMDPALVDKAAAMFKEDVSADLVTNVFPRSFPKGESVEAVRVTAFRKAYAGMRYAEEKEHITQFFYRHPALFKIVNFSSGVDAGAQNLSIDTAEDLAMAERIFGLMDRPPVSYGWSEILALMAGAQRS